MADFVASGQILIGGSAKTTIRVLRSKIGSKPHVIVLYDINDSDITGHWEDAWQDKWEGAAQAALKTFDSRKAMKGHWEKAWQNKWQAALGQVPTSTAPVRRVSNPRFTRSDFSYSFYDNGNSGGEVSGTALVSVYKQGGGVRVSGAAFAAVVSGFVSGVRLSGTAIVKKVIIRSGIGGATSAGTAFVELIEGDMSYDATQITYTPFVGHDRTVHDKLQEIISVKDFGAVGDATQDDSQAIQDAIDWAATTDAYNKTIIFPNGLYIVSREIIIPQGVMLKGDGSQGSTDRYGTVIRHYGNTHCFHFDGSGDLNAGTGGGLENMLIEKFSGSGGIAVYISAIDDSHRPGEMMLTNILSFGRGSASWDHGLVIDGSACNTSGQRGIRHISLRKCRFADVNTIGKTVVLNQVSHFYAHGLNAERGSGATGGLYIQGISDGIYLNGSGVIGTLEIIANDSNNYTRNFDFDGKIIGNLINNDDQLTGTMLIAGLGGDDFVYPGCLVNKSKSLKIVSDLVPYFFAKRTSDFANATGNGDEYNVQFNSVSDDILEEFVSDTFTCGCAGTYNFDYCVTLSNLGASHIDAEIGIVKAGGSSQEYLQMENPYNKANSSNQASFSGSCCINLDYGDTIKLQVAVAGGTKVVGVYGTSTNKTWFSGRYIS